jgi:opacity protein-like surface antigen
MRSKLFYFTMTLCCITQFLFAQIINLKSMKPEAFATTGLGVSIPNTSFKQVSKNGFKTFTGAEFQLMNHYWTRVSYEISLYGYNNTKTENGYTFKSEGTRTLLGGFLDMGYRQEIKTFAIYGYGGVGILWLNSTNTSIDNTRQVITTSPVKKTHLSLRVGGGIELEVRPRFIPFIEYQYGALLERTKVDNRKLNFSNIFFGFKARLKRNN